MTILPPAAWSARNIFGIAMVVAALSLALWHVRVETVAFFPTGLLRLCVSLAAVTVAYMARRQTLFTRALYVLGVEAVGGVIAFVLIDVPFVEGHSADIGNFAIAAFERITAR